MFISRVRLKNWKNFKEIDVNISERTFIVGANAVGKSNLLDVFRFLRDLVKEGGGLQEAVRLRGGITKLRCLYARGSSKTDVEIEVTLSDSKTKEKIWKYAVGMTQKGGGSVKENRAVLRFEKVWHQNQCLLDRPLDSDKEDETLCQYTHLEQPTSNSKFRKIAEFLKKIDYQHIVPQLIRNPLPSPHISASEDYFGRDLFVKMDKLPAKTKDSQLKKIEKALKYAVPNLSNLKLIKDHDGVPHLEAVFEHWRPHGAKQNEYQFSDGTLRMIGLFFAMLNGKEPLLLEEPELSLHSGVVKNISSLIDKMQKRKSEKRQVILSTHSYDLLDNQSIYPDEIILIVSEGENTHVQNVENIVDIKELLLSGLTPAEVVVPKTKTQKIEQLSLSFN